MGDFFFASDPWSALHHLAYAQPLASSAFYLPAYAQPGSSAFYHPAYAQPGSSAFYHPAYAQHPASSAYAHRRPFMSPAASPSGTQRRPLQSPAPAPSPAPSPAPAQKPRVASIPVRYVEVQGGDNRRAAAMGMPPSEAATRIQKVFRGFFVRKVVTRVSQIAAEVDAVEEMMASEAERDKIRSEPRERLRVGETLMALLLRLDSVFGVREYRRKVIRRVIKLQEMVDSIPTAAPTPEAPTQTADETVGKEKTEEMAIDEALEEQETSGKTAVVESADIALVPDAEETPEEETAKSKKNNLTPPECKAEEMMPQEEQSDAIAEEEDAQKNQAEVALEAAESQDGTSKLMEACEEKHVINDEFDDFVVVPMDEDFHSSSALAAAEPETANKDYLVESCIGADERDTAPPEPAETAIAPAVVVKNSQRGGEMKEVVEKVMAESEKLQRLMAALCERNTQQCQLIAGLVSRVDRLEQTVQNMESKKKKKRPANNNLSSPVGKKNNHKME